MTSKEFALLSVLALLSGSALVGIPDSVWWDTGAILPRVLVGLSVAAVLYVAYRIIKNIG